MNRKKRILIFIDWFLPGFRSGGPVTSCQNLIEHLGDEFEFFVVTRDRDYHENIPYPDIRKNVWIQRDSITCVYYFSPDKLSVSNIRKLISSLEFDSVYLNGIFSFYFTLIPLYLAKNKNKRIVLATRGMLAPGALSVKPVKKKAFIFFSKLFGLFSNVVFQASSEIEKNDIKKHFADAVIKIAQNLPKKVELKAVRRGKVPGKLQIINIARISPEKNLLFLLKVLSQCSSVIDLDYYGSIHDQNYWIQCQNVLNTLPSNIKATHHGPVEPKDIPDLLYRSHLMFMPTLGENFGHIIFESLACGCPVLISDRTNWKGLETSNAGWDISLNEEEKFIKIIEKAADLDQEEFNRMSDAAIELAKKFISDKDVIQKNLELFI